MAKSNYRNPKQPQENVYYMSNLRSSADSGLLLYGHKMKTLTKHAIDLLCKSPLDYWFHYENPERPDYLESAESKFDKALRYSVFNSEEAFRGLYVTVQRDWNFKSPTQRAEYATMVRATSERGQIFMISKDFNRALKMRQSLLNHPIAGKRIINHCTLASNTVYTTEGVSIQFKPHASHPGFGHGSNLVNLTSIKDASQSGFSKSAEMFGWHRKAAIQIDGTESIEMLFVVCEDKEPFNVGVYVLDERALELGRQQYKEAIERYHESVASGVWAGVSPTIVTAGLPEWAYKK